MNGQNSSSTENPAVTPEKILNRLAERYTLSNRGKGWWLTTPQIAYQRAKSVSVPDEVVYMLETEKKIIIEIPYTSAHARLLMHRITSAQFRDAVKLDPAWASKRTEPVEITDFCNMMGSRITHLSPLLNFTGRNKYGDSASFYNCRHLKIAEGKFSGSVSFSRSEIQKIGNLTCGRSNYGNSAYFYKCKFLKVAEGEFPGFVSFYGSGIQEIKDFSCEKNNGGMRLCVDNCHNLTGIPINFSPEEVGAGSRLLKKLEMDRFSQKKLAEIAV